MFTLGRRKLDLTINFFHSHTTIFQIIYLLIGDKFSVLLSHITANIEYIIFATCYSAQNFYRFTYSNRKWKLSVHITNMHSLSRYVSFSQLFIYIFINTIIPFQSSSVMHYKPKYQSIFYTGCPIYLTNFEIAISPAIFRIF